MLADNRTLLWDGRLCVLLLVNLLLPLFAIEGVCALEFTSGTQVSAIMEKARVKKEYVGGTYILNEQEYPALEPYFQDPDIFVRRQADQIARNSAEYSSSLSVRQKYVEHVLQCAFDWEAYGPSVGILQQYCPEHFSEKARVMLGEQLRRAIAEYETTKTDNTRECLNSLILCVSTADATEHKDILQDIRKKFGGEFGDLTENANINKYTRNSQADGWFSPPALEAAKALATMGEKEEIEYCIRLADTYPHPEPKEMLFFGLELIGQPEVLDYFYRHMTNSATYVDHSGKRRTLGWLCAGHVLSMIADKELRKSMSDGSDLVKTVRAYVKEKAGGDPKKLPIRNRTKANRERLESLRQQAISEKQKKRQAQQASDVSTAPTADSSTTVK